MLRILALTLAALAAVSAARFDPDQNYYCGIKPFPAEAEDYPALPKDAVFHHQTSFFRHGARSPISANTCFPNDKIEWDICTNSMHMTPSILGDRFSIEGRARMGELGGSSTAYAFPVHPLPGSQAIPGSCALGHLSDRGFWQAYAQGRRIGRALRGYYEAQGRNLTLKNMDFRSTDVHRTRATGISLGVGIIDTAVFDIAAADAPAAATSLVTGPEITYRDRTGDALTMSTDLCGGKAYIKEAYADPAWVQYDKEQGNPLREIVGYMSGEKTTDIDFMFDCVKTRLCHNKEVPEIYNENVDAMFADYLDKYWGQVFFYNHTYASQVITGPLLSKIYTDFAHRASIIKRGDKKAPTVSLRAGHDFGPMMNLVAALRIFDRADLRWPPYTSTLSLEMFSVAGEVFVRAIHDGKARPIGICDGLGRSIAKQITGVEACSIDDFLNGLQPMIPEPGQCSDTFPGPLAAAQYKEIRSTVEPLARRKLDYIHRVGCSNAAAESTEGPMAQRSDEELWESKRLGN